MHQSSRSEHYLPLSAAQRSRWFAYQFEPQRRGLHNNGFAAYVQGSLDRATFAGALECLAARHPMLRAQMRELDGEPLQCILSDAPVSVTETWVDDGERGSLPQRVAADFARPFGADDRVLMRAHLYRCAADLTVMVLVFDHIAVDGWSYWQLLEELGQLLAEPGATPAAGAGGASYADYVHWQRDWMRSDAAAKQLQYWQEQLGGQLPLLQLHGDRRASAQSGERQQKYSLVLTPQLTARLEKLARGQSANLLTVLLAGYNILQHRYTGQEDLIVGCPMPGRSDPAWDSVVGDFVNPVPVRTRLQPQDTVADVCRTVRRAVMQGMARQEYPFASLVEHIHGSRRSGEHPIFQTTFAFQNARQARSLAPLWQTADSAAQVPWGGLMLRPFPVHQTGVGAYMPLALETLQVDQEIRCDFKYDPERFDEATIERMAGHFSRLLDQMAASPETPVARLDMLGSDERHQLLSEFGAGGRHFPCDDLIHGLFERQAVSEPARVALRYEDDALTYEALNRRANQVAHRLLQLGVKPDDRVAVAIARGLDMVVGLMGVLKAGAAYVPLDPDYPAERIAYMLTDSAPVVLLTQGGLVPQLPAVSVPLVLIDDDAMLAAQPASNPVVPGLSASNLAYVIYTSGSTGRPKGVMIEHRNVVRLIAATQPWFGFGADDVWSQFHSSAFDFSVWELWTPLATGGKAVIVPAMCARSPRDFYALLCREGVTVLNQTPSAFRQLIAAQADVADERQHSLRYVIFGGEALELHTLAPWIERNDAERTTLVNMYGITETTVHVSYRVITPADVTAGRGSVIGVPIPDLRIRILDADLQPVPIGVAGELYVGGGGVARGYLNRPELTAERFIDDPLDDTPGARLYKTGDLGRWLADGDIEYLGRNDFQVKIRGFRIELGEIEARLAGCPEVREAVVLARPDSQGEARLIGYVVAQAGAELSVAALRTQLAALLPSHMVPTAIVLMEKFPLTANGKLDRAALPDADLAALARAPYEAPHVGLEADLAVIWQELLGLPQVGRHDNFFDVGGHSLLAARLLARMRQTFGVEVTLRELFDHPSLSGMAALMPAAERPAELSIPPRDPAVAPPLSFAQQGLWFLDRFDPASSAAYTMPGAWRLTGPLDVAALRRSFDALVARHEVLRTHVADTAGGPVQVVEPAGSRAVLACQDLRPHPAPLDAARTFYETEARQAFNLAQGPLLRATLLTLGDDDHVLVLVKHHIVSDGWSVHLLLKEVGTFYEAFSRGHGAPLAPLPLQYADYAIWQRTRLHEGLLREQTAFWRRELEGAPALLELPTDRPRPATQDYAGGSCTLTLPAESAEAIRRLGREHGVTLFMTLLAAWATLLARLSGQEQVVIGTPSANRTRSELEGVIGLFVNTLALRVRLDADPSVAQLLAAVKATTLEAYAHQDLPFEQVVEALNPERSTSHSPLFQAMLAMDAASDDAGLALAGLQVQNLPRAQFTSQFDLSLNVREQGGQLHAELTYARALFDQGSAVALLRRWGNLLAVMAAAPAHRVSQLPIVDAEESQVLAKFNATALPYPEQGLLHHAFEAQAAAEPDRVALVSNGRTLSYGELNRRANRIAHWLLRQGVRPDDRVALSVPRTADMVAGMLGILKAGAAYVPLDPAYPAERLAYMLADCAPVALLGQGMSGAGVRDANVPLLLLDDEVQVAGEPDHDPIVAGLGSHNLAYIIYTSGSTGQPKGVMIEHRNAVNFVTWARQAFAPDVLDRTLFSTSINFDLAVFELFVPLSAGRRVVLVQNVLCPADELRDVTLINTVPSAIDALLKVDGVPNSAQVVNLAGEPLKRALVERIFANTAVETVGNLYGPSETTTYSTFVLMSRADGFSPHIGRPVANTCIHILDRHRMPVPIGVAGELYIGGAGVARGYLNRPELTAERFIADPFDATPGARLYKTGDLGRWLPDGNIEYLGRNDFQVKIRGFRIELGEIEARLAGCPGVREAVVLARPDSQGEAHLIGYVAARDGAVLSTAALRTQLGALLPSHMVPAVIVLLEAFPLTPNGKLDRAALPAPDLAGLAGGSYEAPRPGLETDLATLWQELLDLPQVGRHDNFFDIGGHSLRAVRMLNMLHARHQVRVSLADLFRHPVLAQLAAVAAAGSATGFGPIARLAGSGPHALSLAQSRLWMAQQLDPHSTAYSIPVAMTLPPATTPAELAEVLNLLVERHEALRTVFPARDGQPAQQILPPTPLHLTHAAVTSQHELDELVAAHAHLPFDLAHGPVVRCRMVSTWDGRKLLLWNMHHIVGDGVSLEILSKEILALLGAAPETRATLLAPLPIRYVDFAAWQAERVEADEADSGAYWLEQLGGDPVALDLPYDYPVADHVGANGAAYRVDLTKTELARLQAFAGGQQATLFMVALSGLLVLLSRMTGKNDLVVGTPVAGREHPDTHNLVGCFINTVMLRNRLEEGDTVASFLARVKANTLQALTHQSYPFERLLDELNVGRDLNRFPISPVFINLLSSTDARDALQNAGHRALQQDVKFDLNFYLREDAGGISVDCHYRTACFKPETIAYIVDQYTRLLERMTALPETLCSELDALPLPPGGMPLPTVLAARPYTPFAPEQIEQSIPARFARQVEKAGAAVAVKSPGRVLTYLELDREADAVARALVRRCGSGNDRVALLFEHDTPMIVGLLGALKAGKAYVPLDPNYPPARLRYMLENSGAQVVVTNRRNLALARELGNAGHTIVDIDRLDDDLDATELPAVIDPASLAYILYTSGSTGQPKGVMQSHRNALYFCRSYTNNLSIDASDRVLLLASYSFDAAVMDIFGALMNGATLYPVDPKVTPAAELLAWMDAERISIYHSTPTLYRHLFPHGTQAPDSVRLAVLGGELVSRDDIARFKSVFGPDCVFINGYGPTESTLALQNFITHATDLTGGAVPAGYAVPGTTITLGQPGARPHVWQRGEIIIQSPYVALGYWANEEQTMRAFGSRDDCGRYYRTGDIGYFRQDGSLVVAGRIDNQVKIRGFRIELGEIEAQLQASQGVREAVVVAREQADGERCLVAYLIMDDVRITSSQLRARLLATLPEYMVPAAFMLLERFPQTPSGKLDRAQLPAPQFGTATTAAHELPQGELETALAAIWRGLLGIDSLGRHDSFFELGGHSLLAIRMISRVREQLGAELSLRELFVQSTLEQVARRVEASVRSASEAIPRIPRAAVLPMSFAQQRLWFLDQLDRSAGAAYHMSAGLRLRGPLQANALEAALAHMVERHESLRTTFVSGEGEAGQHIAAPPAGIELFRVDLRDLPAVDREAALQQVLAQQLATPFDLASGPLVRPALIQTDNDEHVLSLVLHHIICDGWSLGVMASELSVLYRAFVQDQPDPLPQLPVQYADYAAWQRGRLSGVTLQRHIEFWRRRMDGAPALITLPLDRARPAVQSHAGGQIDFSLSAELSEGVREMSQRHGTTLFMTLLAAWGLLLSELSGQDDIVVGSPVANREHGDVEGLIGFFVNTLPLRVCVDKQATVDQLLAQVKTLALDAYAHQELPFDQLVQALKPPRDRSYSPVFQVMLAMNPPLEDALALPGISTSEVVPERLTTHYDLSLTFTEGRGALAGSLAYASDLFDVASVAGIVAQFEAVLQGMVDDDRRPVRALLLDAGIAGGACDDVMEEVVW